MEYLQYSKQTKNYGTNFIVLNLVINGIPSILINVFLSVLISLFVLNLVINGIPSILKDTMGDEIVKDEF